MIDAGRPAAFVAIAVVGALLLVGLLVILRVLGRRVAIEEAEEVLRAELERDEEAIRGGYRQ
jgi:hypothetical protein